MALISTFKRTDLILLLGCMIFRYCNGFSISSSFHLRSTVTITKEEPTCCYRIMMMSNSDSEENIPARVVSSIDPTLNKEISRRVALVMAAVMATGSIVSEAEAATIQRQVIDIERTNLSTVNTKGAPEKHIPIVTINDKSVEVKIPHVMDAEKPHYIEYVWLKDVTSKKILAVQKFQPTDPSPPSIICNNIGSSASIQGYGYCNLHGLWESDIISI